MAFATYEARGGCGGVGGSLVMPGVGLFFLWALFGLFGGWFSHVGFCLNYIDIDPAESKIVTCLDPLPLTP